MIETVDFKGLLYPAFQASGFAARFAFPFAKELCKGRGFDIGCNRQEWALPGSIPIDPAIESWDAFDGVDLDYGKRVLRTVQLLDGMSLPDLLVDYIFSSHCLEHLPDWVGALNHWTMRLKKGGVLFLYLPHPDQMYWRPWNNRKHLHSLSPDLIRDYLLESGNYCKIFVSERDLNHSFCAVAERR